MKIKSIRWRLSITYAAISLVGAIILGGIMLFILRNYYSQQEIDYLSVNAESIGAIFSEAVSRGIPDEGLEELVKGFSFMSNARIRILDQDNELLIDSGIPDDIRTFAFDPGSVGNDPFGMSYGFPLFPSDVIISDMPYDGLNGPIIETYTASDPILIPGGTGGLQGWVIGSTYNELELESLSNESFSRSNQIVLRPFYDNGGELLGNVELSSGPAYGNEIIRSVAKGLAIAGSIAVILAAGMGAIISRRFSDPLESLTKITSQMTAGDLSVRSSTQNDDEFGVLANSFNQMADSIEEKIETLKRFVADAAHEIHSPLTAVQTTLEIYSDENSVVALKEIDRLNRLSKNLLDLSLLEAGRDSFETGQIDLVQVVNNLVEPFASRAEQAIISFETSLEDEPVWIKGDSDQLSIMFQNLIDNAIKFTPSGGRVRVSLEKTEEKVLVNIEDSGIGIPEEDQPFLFSRFHRGRNTTNFPGSGLGLAISKAIADLHGVEIAIQSNSEGTDASITFERIN